MHKPHITIIGAGISGLSLAFFLKQALGDKIVLTVLENRGEPGGTIGTTCENGFLEEKGPNGFLDNRPATWELIYALNLENKVVRASAAAQNRYVYHRGRLRKVPDSVPKILSSDLLSPAGKFRLFLEPFIPPKHADTDETLERFFTRRIGREAMERLADPFVSGIYAASLERMSARATFPKLADFEARYGSLLKGFIKSRKDTVNANSPAPPRKRAELTSFSKGLSVLVRRLAEELQAEIHVNSPVFSVEYRQEGAPFALMAEREGRGSAMHEADVVIISVPAYAASKLVSKLDPELEEILTGIPYSPVHVVALGFSENAFRMPLDGFGYLFSKCERREVLGCLFSSSIFPGRAPDRKVLLRVLLGGSEYPEAAGYADRKILDLALSNLKQVLGLSQDPEWIRIFRYERAVPQYTIGHLERLRRIEEIAKRFPGLYLTGNAYLGIGINDCIEESKRLAGEIVDCYRTKYS